MFDFPASRDAALTRLHDFVPKAGRAYASGRNYDRAGSVSALSPYIRHRIITEEEVLRVTRAAHSFSAAQKFIQEVYWRTYWKGWLELRPGVWDAYKAERDTAWNQIQTASGQRKAWEAACNGDTGIACFDHWAQELTTTGYLHNHARMWFASIWIFTLRLPWTLGADFFLRHLLDGDAASNTLSWRWVAGLQTVGRTYLARPANIAEYTEGRFEPTDLATFAPALEGPPHPAPGPVPTSDSLPTEGRTGLLVTEDDMSPAWVSCATVATAKVATTSARSHLHVAPQVIDFAGTLLDDIDGTRYDAVDLQNWIDTHALTGIVTPYIPIGPTRDALMPVFAKLSVPVAQQMRPYDAAAWPYATKGFFKFKDAIPKLIAAI